MKKAGDAGGAWTCADSAELYGIQNWGNGLFGISGDGEVVAKLTKGGKSVDCSLASIAQDLRERGVDFPVLLRFGDVLDSRIARINDAFEEAIRQAKYKGGYRGVYPIKVNQQEQVVCEITSFGRQYHHGLEAGSKAELVAALSYMHDPDAFIVCNGYKDEEFIDLALYALKMGLAAAVEAYLACLAG